MYYFNNKYHLLSVLLFCVFISCEPPQNNNNNVEPYLARVYDKKLYEKDLDGIVGKNVSSMDSAMIVKGFIENWTRDNMMLALAQKNMTKDKRIERLVEDYRSALILNSYQEKLLQNFDNIQVTEEELLSYYEENKNLYPLKMPIVRCFYTKIKKKSKGIETLKAWWKNGRDKGSADIINYIKEDAESYLVDEEKWYPLKEIIEKMPKGTIKPWYSKADGKYHYTSDDEFRYYLIIHEFLKSDEPTPFEIVKGDITKIVLKKKRSEELKIKSDKHYRDELEMKNIEIL